MEVGSSAYLSALIVPLRMMKEPTICHTPPQSEIKEATMRSSGDPHEQEERRANKSKERTASELQTPLPRLYSELHTPLPRLYLHALQPFSLWHDTRLTSV